MTVRPVVFYFLLHGLAECPGTWLRELGKIESLVSGILKCVVASRCMISFKASYIPTGLGVYSAVATLGVI